MDQLLQKLQELGRESQKLEWSPEGRQQMLETAGRFSDEFLAALNTGKGYSTKIEQPGSLNISGAAHPLSDLLAIYRHEVTETGINAASGKHLGYIPGGGIFAAAVGDLLAAVSNPYASVYYASPGAAALETAVIDWLKEIFSFPATAVGNLSSGGSLSTLIALTAARDKFQVKNEKVQHHVVYLSRQVHHAAQKALRIIGLEDVQMRYIPLDDNHRLIPGAVEEQMEKDLAAGLQPFLLIGTAGTTDTGAVDPLDKLADVAAKYKVWFHVDAAYGGFFILTSKNDLFKGIERADSLIVDPHKSLFLPYGLGAVLVRESDPVLHSNHYAAGYMQDAGNEDLLKSPANLSPELTKHFRGLRLWLPLQLHGVEPFAACLEEKLLLVKYFRHLLQKHQFQVGPEPDLSVTYFWYPFKSDADRKNKLLMSEIHRDGDVFLSSSVIDERFVIRIAILAFRTKLETVERTMNMILRCLQNVQDQED